MKFQNTTQEKVTVEELRDEVLAMFEVCFEGKVSKTDDKIRLELPGGESFSVFVCAD